MDSVESRLCGDYFHSKMLYQDIFIINMYYHLVGIVSVDDIMYYVDHIYVYFIIVIETFIIVNDPFKNL